LLLGYFKKVVVADNLAVIADTVFNHPGQYQGLAVLIGVYAFAFQIYGDFSGYSDIARGLSKLMGFDLMVNFRMPYFATNPQEFWHRWHISLSTWLRDYLYIPLGGSRQGTIGTYKNLFLTMFLGGLWHGAAWNFVIWGVYQGAILIIHRLAVGKLEARPKASIPKHVLKVVCMFHVVCLGWVFFRVNTMADFPVMLESLFNWEISQLKWGMEILFFVLPLFVLQVFKERSGDLRVVKRLPPWGRAIVYGVFFTYILLCGKVSGNEFIYFQF
jgi:D-alanyl-lipoteichoic acid acyltransferase DltB (MBOAT superfamily)